MIGRMLKSWCTLHQPAMLGCLWMAVLLGPLTWLDLRDGGIFLIPPFAATLAILVYQPNVPIAQPIAVVCGSLLGAAIGTVLSVLLGFGPGVALLAALTAVIMLPLLRVFHPPRNRSGDVPCFAALRSMVCDSGGATIYACRGDLSRGA
jgi:CBS-domain-containing membrane protein